MREGGESSPLARGLHPSPSTTGRTPRIIPARAGFTPGVRPLLFGVFVSSPLARGLHAYDASYTDVYDIIPARAGFTHMRRKLTVAEGHHPRSRGVYTEGLPVGKSGH